MKIRVGFVSNSSTTSFVCLGIDGDEEKIQKLLKRFYERNNIGKDEEIEDIYDFLGDDGLISCDNYIGEIEYSIGIEYEEIIKNKIFKDLKVSELKQKVAEILSKKFGEEINVKDIKHIEHAYRDS